MYGLSLNYNTSFFIATGKEERRTQPLLYKKIATIYVGLTKDAVEGPHPILAKLYHLTKDLIRKKNYN